MITVKFYRLAHPVQEVALSAGATVQQGLEAVGWLGTVTETRMSIQVNGVPSDLCAVLRDGDRVIVAKEVRGN